MLTGIVRVLLGVALACLAAGVAQVLVVQTPGEIIDTITGAGRSGPADLLYRVLAVTTHTILFAAPFALIAAAAGEWLELRGWLYYTIIGLAIASMGLFAEYNAEAAGAPTILNAFAAAAFALAGLTGGLVYWISAGKRAGGRRRGFEVLSPKTDGPAVTIVSAPATRSTFTLEQAGATSSAVRLVAPEKLERADFYKIAERLNVKPLSARKIGYVAGRKADTEETVVTKWNGKETTNTARPGDWIVTNMSADRDVLKDKDGNANTYVIKAETFPILYDPVSGENEFGRYFKAKSIVEAVHFPGGFDILAPWGQKQTAHDGYLLLNGKEVYGNNAETFEATYDILR